MHPQNCQAGQAPVLRHLRRMSASQARAPCSALSACTKSTTGVCASDASMSCSTYTVRSTSRGGKPCTPRCQSGHGRSLYQGLSFQTMLGLTDRDCCTPAHLKRADNCKQWRWVQPLTGRKALLRTHTTVPRHNTRRSRRAHPAAPPQWSASAWTCRRRWRRTIRSAAPETSAAPCSSAGCALLPKASPADQRHCKYPLLQQSCLSSKQPLSWPSLQQTQNPHHS